MAHGAPHTTQELTTLEVLELVRDRLRGKPNTTVQGKRYEAALGHVRDAIDNVRAAESDDGQV